MRRRTAPGVQTTLHNVNMETLPLLLHAYIMEALCEGVFVADEWYKTIFGEDQGYQAGMLAAWRRSVLATSDITAVQTIDAMAFKLGLEKGGDHFSRQVLPQQAANITSQLCQTLDPFFKNSENYYPFPRDQRRNTLRACAELLLCLKFELLLSSKQYEITWTPNSALFDAQVMQRAEESPEGRFVDVCVSPGLVEYDAQPATELEPDDYGSVLMCNKTFYPGRNVVRNNRVVIAKSVVSLED